MKRETDVVARFGGEEFCVLLEETDTEGAVLFASYGAYMVWRIAAGG